MLQAIPEQLHIETSMQIKRRLFKVSPRPSIQQTVEQHAFLHRCQRVDIFQLADVSRLRY
ncbi:hypothetical protein D1872_314440 [compost metagenome]